MNLVDRVNELYGNYENVKKFDNFKSGDTVAVHAKIREGEKERIQVFQGIVIAIKKKGKIDGHFRVRKVATGGYGVERVFHYHSYNIAEVKLVSRGKTTKAKHFYLRDRTGKSAKIAIDYSKQA